jgi:hypothetical protein
MKNILFSLLLLLGCSSSEDVENKPIESMPNVVNGVATSDYKAVVQIIIEHGLFSESYCTGTFIKDDLLITASHCVDGGKVVRLSTGAKSIGILKNPLYKRGSGDWVSQDFALVRFKKGTSKYTLPLATKPIKDKDVVTLVGFGINDYRRDGEASINSVFGVKRTATNVYSVNRYLIDQGIIRFNGRSTNVSGKKGDGTRGSLGQGDSGGSLLVNGAIVGIASAQLLQNTDMAVYTNDSYYAYTLSNYATTFFKTAKDRGFFDGNVTQPIDPTPIPDGTLKVVGVGGEEDGIYSLAVSGIPSNVYTVKFYWGYENLAAFHTESVNGRKSFETAYMWDFNRDKRVKIEFVSKTGVVLNTIKIILK